MKMEESLLFWGMNDWQNNLFVLQWSDLGEESRALMPFTKVSGFHEKDTAIHSHATPIIQIFFLLKREYYSNLTAPFHPAFLYFCIQSVRNKENVACFNVFMAKKGERFIHSLTNHSQGRSINKQIEYRGSKRPVSLSFLRNLAASPATCMENLGEKNKGQNFPLQRCHVH